MFGVIVVDGRTFDLLNMKKYIFLIFAFATVSFKGAMCCDASMAGPFVKIGNFVKDTAEMVGGSMAGGKLSKDPIKGISDILIEIPKELRDIKSVMSDIRDLSNEINKKYRSITSIEELQQLERKMDEKIEKIEKEYIFLSKNETLKTMEVVNMFCSSPPIMMIITIPGLGQVVSSLCGSLATESTRVDTSLANAEPVIDLALKVKEDLNDRIVEIKESFVGVN